MLQVEMYRGLMISSAFLHAMVRDLIDSPSYCFTDNQPYNAYQLAANLESIMCLILHLETNKETLFDFYPVAKYVLETTELPRYFNCSAKYFIFK